MHRVGKSGAIFASWDMLRYSNLGTGGLQAQDERARCFQFLLNFQ